MKFICDENVPRDMARILNLFDKTNTVDWLPDHFGRGAKDTEWIPKAGAMTPRPVIVATDGRILRNAVERAALKSSKLTFVYLLRGWADLSWDARVPKMIKAWPSIAQEVGLLRSPAVLEVAAGNGKVTRTQYLRDLKG